MRTKKTEEKKKFDLEEAFVLWLSKSKEGKEYLTGHDLNKNRIIGFFNEKSNEKQPDIKLYQTDDKGKPIYTLNTVTATIKQVPALVRDLDEAERSIAKEIAQSDKVRGAQTKSIYEDF